MQTSGAPVIFEARSGGRSGFLFVNVKDDLQFKVKILFPENILIAFDHLDLFFFVALGHGLRHFTGQAELKAIKPLLWAFINP